MLFSVSSPDASWLSRLQSGSSSLGCSSTVLSFLASLWFLVSSVGIFKDVLVRVQPLVLRRSTAWWDKQGGRLLSFACGCWPLRVVGVVGVVVPDRHGGDLVGEGLLGLALRSW